MPLGVLVFVIGMLMVLNLWSVIETKMAVNAAARESARAIEEAGTGSEADSESQAAGRAALSTFFGDRPLEPGRWVDPAVYETRNGRNAWQRCAVFVVEAHYPAPLVRLPLVGALGTSITVTGSASGVVDPYRASAGQSDEERTATC